MRNGGDEEGKEQSKHKEPGKWLRRGWRARRRAGCSGACRERLARRPWPSRSVACRPRRLSPSTRDAPLTLHSHGTHGTHGTKGNRQHLTRLRQLRFIRCLLSTHILHGYVFCKYLLFLLYSHHCHIQSQYERK